MTLVIAHRGASTAAPENTVEAFALATELGADGVELDARRTLDGPVVVHHDAHLPDGRLIVATAASDLPATVPSLAAALDACGDLVVNVEVKNLPGDPDYDPGEAVVEAVMAEVERRSMGRQALISSFNLATVDRARTLDPAVPTAWLVFAVTDPMETVDRTVRHGHGALHPWDGLVDAALVRAAHERGLAVNVWTVDDPDRMRALVDMGADGIVTNVPDVARHVIGAPN